MDSRHRLSYPGEIFRPEADSKVEPSPKKLLLRALAGERTERPPIWLMRQAGRYLPEYLLTREAAGGMLGLCNSPQHAAEVTLQPIRRFQLDAAILFADLPQLAAALGQTLEYRAGATHEKLWVEPDRLLLTSKQSSTLRTYAFSQPR